MSDTLSNPAREPKTTESAQTTAAVAGGVTPNQHSRFREHMAVVHEYAMLGASTVKRREEVLTAVNAAIGMYEGEQRTRDTILKREREKQSKLTRLEEQVRAVEKQRDACMEMAKAERPPDAVFNKALQDEYARLKEQLETHRTFVDHFLQWCEGVAAEEDSPIHLLVAEAEALNPASAPGFSGSPTSAGVASQVTRGVAGAETSSPASVGAESTAGSMSAPSDPAKEPS